MRVNTSVPVLVDLLTHLSESSESRGSLLKPNERRVVFVLENGR